MAKKKKIDFQNIWPIQVNKLVNSKHDLNNILFIKNLQNHLVK